MQKLDLTNVGGLLTDWLAARMPGANNLELSGFVVPKAGNSAETILFDASFDEGGARRTQSLVLRRQLEGADLFMDVNLQLQVDVMKAMAGRPGVTVPTVIGLEKDRALLGSPFYVMTRIEGRVLAQEPNYNKTSWLADMPPAQRHAVWKNNVEAIARVHRIDWRDGFEFMSDPSRGAPGFDQYFNYVERWFAWAAKGRKQPTADAALAWLKKNRPANPALGVCWGDPIPANTIFTPEGEVAALIDWEAAALGPGELDLGWFLFFDGFYSEGMGVPRLEGLPSREEIIAIYEAEAGRKVDSIDYYEILAMLRLGIISVRFHDRQVGLGHVSAENTSYKNNPIQAMIARRIGLPVPEVGQDFLDILKAATLQHQ